MQQRILYQFFLKFNYHFSLWLIWGKSGSSKHSFIQEGSCRGFVRSIFYTALLRIESARYFFAYTSWFFLFPKKFLNYNVAMEKILCMIEASDRGPRARTFFSWKVGNFVVKTSLRQKVIHMNTHFWLNQLKLDSDCV